MIWLTCYFDLQEGGQNVSALTGDLTWTEREKRIERFRNGTVNVLVTSSHCTWRLGFGEVRLAIIDTSGTDLLVYT